MGINEQAQYLKFIQGVFFSWSKSSIVYDL